MRISLEMKQRDNPTRPAAMNAVSDITSKGDKARSNILQKNKIPPVGFDKRNPKPLLARNFLLPTVLQADVPNKLQHPFLSSELGGNMLNLNHIYNNEKGFVRRTGRANSNPHIHIENFLHGFRELSAPLLPINSQVKLFSLTIFFSCIF